jgi:ABC-type molybdate transport system substrate-binding protein
VPRALRALALLAALSLPPPAVAGEMRAPLQVLADAALGGALREIDALGWCGKEPRAELYLAGSPTLLALALRGERADVVVAGGRDALAPLVAAGLAAAPRRFATHEGVDYWIAPLRAARSPEGARAFVDAVLSRPGREALERRGFAPAE